MMYRIARLWLGLVFFGTAEFVAVLFRWWEPDLRTVALSTFAALAIVGGLAYAASLKRWPVPDRDDEDRIDDAR